MPPGSDTTSANPTVIAPYESADQTRMRSRPDQAVIPQQSQHYPHYIYDRRPGFFDLHDTMPFSQGSGLPPHVPMENLSLSPDRSWHERPGQQSMFLGAERENFSQTVRRGDPSALAATHPASMDSELDKNHMADLGDLVYISPIDPNLTCAICYCPFDRPIKLPCEHYFCSKCIGQHLQSQPRNAQNCPSCRSRITLKSLSPVSKIIEYMLEGLKIKCPLHKEGCESEMTRGSAQDHLKKYCDFYEVRCPKPGCNLPVQRRHARSLMDRCLHQLVICDDCKVQVLELDIDAHRDRYCSVGVTRCPDCKETVKRLELEAHIQECPEAIFTCRAVVYGCDFVGKRSVLDPHQSACTLSQLLPFLKRQNEMLQEHDAALKHLQHKNSILETSFQIIQETLGPSSNLVDSPSRTPTTPTAAGGPFDSTAHHLLSLHESLREEVSRVSATVSEVDHKATMMVMNESLRTTEQLSHANAAIGGMRHQLQWLVSARLQNEQRMAMVRAQTANSGSSPPRSASNSGQAAAAGPSTSLMQPVRRLSDSTRQETKL